MTNWADTPAGMIDRLDEALSRRGEDAILRRVVGTSNQQFVDVAIRVMIQETTPEPMTPGGAVTQDRSMIILSPTQIDAAGWPGGVPPNFIGDPRVPLKGYQMIARGRARNIETVTAKVRGGTLVRLELTVAG